MGPGEGSPLLPTRNRDDSDASSRTDPGKRTNTMVIWVIFGVLAAILIAVRVLPMKRTSGVFMAVVDYDGAMQIVRMGTSSDASNKAVAYGELVYAATPNQWSYLTLETPKSIKSLDDWQRTMYGVGYMEGALTCTAIKRYYHNFASTINDGHDLSELTKRFIAENWNWMREHSMSKNNEDPFWTHVHGLVNQMEGMLEGFIKCDQTDLSNMDLTQRKDALWAAEHIDTLSMEEPTILQFLLLSANGDLFQIMSQSDHIRHNRGAHRDPEDALENGGGEDLAIPTDSGGAVHISNTSDVHTIIESNRRRQRRRRLDLDMTPVRPDHCSALIKVLEDGSDVLFAHTTWDSYSNAAPRIFKRYHLATMEGALEMHFSSSPGMLSSVDDFYTINAWRKPLPSEQGDTSPGERLSVSLAITETSLDVFNEQAIQNIIPEALLSWVRVRVANELSASGREWAENFETHFSGTYSNQWMVMDLNKFDGEAAAAAGRGGGGMEGTPLKEGFLTILEEVPGLLMWQDVTETLSSKGYWASYNMPYFTNIAERSGADARCQVNPDECHDTAPRALQFAQQQASVVDVESLQSVISYNDYKDDPVSLGNSCRTIACREDLEEVAEDRRAFGAIDAKISSLIMAKRDVSNGNHDPSIHVVRLGPTQNVSGEHRPFCWSTYRPPPPLADGHSDLPEMPNEEAPLGHPDCFGGKWQTFPPFSATPNWLNH